MTIANKYRIAATERQPAKPLGYHTENDKISYLANYFTRRIYNVKDVSSSCMDKDSECVYIVRVKMCHKVIPEKVLKI